MLADRGYDADWFSEALKDKGIKPCILGRKARGKPIKHDKRRNRIEIMFGRLKDWRRVATRYDRCPKVFLSAAASPQPSCFGFDSPCTWILAAIRSIRPDFTQASHN